MASQKKSTPISSSDTKTNETFLKARVKELEEEVARLKSRLDGLRKAKNTTITKREREILEVGTPFSKRGSAGAEGKAKHSDDEMAELRQKFAAEMEIMRENLEQEYSCDHEREIAFLKKRVSELEADNAAFMMENEDLKQRVNSLVMELSVKEAKWCELEEQMKKKVESSWQEKYKEWMERTESKIAELQEANALLRTYLKNDRPDGRGPPGPGADY